MAMSACDITLSKVDNDAHQQLIDQIHEINTVSPEGYEVDHLTVHFPNAREPNGWAGDHPVLAPLVELIRLCAPSLRFLYLRGIPLDDYFDVRNSNRSQGDPEVFQPLLGALCACTELRLLYLSRRKRQLTADHSRLILCIAHSLPSLRSLQWRCLKDSGAERPSPFSEAFLSALAETPKPGLRLLQVDECSFRPYNDCRMGGYVLPAPLRVLALNNSDQYFHGRLEGLLCKCRSIEELYLSHFNTESARPPKFARMWPLLQKLRVLTLDVVNHSCDSAGWMDRMSVPEAELPSLKTLIIQNLNCVMPNFNTRCSELTHLAVGFCEPVHLPWLAEFLAVSGSKLQTLQLQLTLNDSDSCSEEEEDYYSDDEDENEDACTEEDESKFDGWGRRSRPPPRPRRPKLQGVFGALGGAQHLEHLQLVFREALDESLATLVECDSFTALPRLATVGIFQDHDEGCGSSLYYGPSTELGSVKFFCKAFGRFKTTGCLPALRKVYFHPVQRASREFYGDVKPMTGTEGFRAVALADPGRAMGKAWLRAAPGAQAAIGLSRAVATMNFERGLRREQRFDNFYSEHSQEASDNEGFGQNPEMEDGKLTAPGWRQLYTECLSDGWSSCDDDYEDDISGDETDGPANDASCEECSEEESEQDGVTDINDVD